jgi:hypothetical protein
VFVDLHHARSFLPAYVSSKVGCVVLFAILCIRKTTIKRRSGQRVIYHSPHSVVGLVSGFYQFIQQDGQTGDGQYMGCHELVVRSEYKSSLGGGKPLLVARLLVASVCNTLGSPLVE